MNFTKLSTNGLLMLHKGVADALASDDATPPGTEPKYGVRETPDWKAWSDAIEAELRSREATFTRIAW